MVKRKGRGGQKRRKAKKAKKQNNNNNPSTSAQQQQTRQVNAAQDNATPPPGMQSSSSRQPLPGPRKGRKKKRLDEVAVTSIGPTSQQNGEKPNDEIPPANSVFPSTQPMPEKRILEFVLDILQRRDTHEIFAQPVDPNEVEGYYSIIENPMDFGTMRAKLQEGMYSTLEQFESDTFLISNNAMLFNSSATIYFRQARAIHELAKRVFHTLKTDPKKFELEFPLTRRRNGRKPQGETGGSHVKLGAKLRGNSLAYHASSGANPHDNEILPGSRDGGNLNFCETERRQMYNPHSEKESIVSTIYSSSKQLAPGNGGIGYKESLLWFVEDLGPMAQEVANQKLTCLSQIPSHFFGDSSCLISSSAAQQQPSCMDGVINGVTVDANNPLGSHVATSKGRNILTSDSVNIDNSACRGKMAPGIDRLNKGKSVVTVGEDSGHQSERMEFPTAGNDCLNTTAAWNTDACYKYMDLQGAVRGDVALCTQNTRNQLGSYLPSAGTANVHWYTTTDRMVGSKLLGDQVQPANLPSRSQSGLLEFLSNSNRRPKSSVYPSKVISTASGSNALLNLNYGYSSAQVSQPLEWSRSTPWVPQAIYDFPQMQPQLGEVNVPGKDRFMQQEPHLTVDQYLQQKPGYANPLGQEAFAHQQELQLALAQNMQPQQPDEANVFGQGAFAQRGWQFSSNPYAQPQPQPGVLNLFGEDLFVQTQQQLPVVSYAQPMPNEVNPLGQDGYVQRGLYPVSQYMQLQHNDVNTPGQNVILPRQTQQLGLTHQGLMSDAGNFRERGSLQGLQPNGNAQFWDFQQQPLRGTQHPDLDLQLRTQNRRS